MEKKLPKYFDQWQPLSAIQPRLNNRLNLQRHKNPPLFRRLLKSGFCKWVFLFIILLLLNILSK